MKRGKQSKSVHRKSQEYELAVEMPVEEVERKLNVMMRFECAEMFFSFKLARKTSSRRAARISHVVLFEFETTTHEYTYM